MVGDRRETVTTDYTRGWLEVRYLVASADPAGVVEWPHVAQVFMVIRSWQQQGQVSQEIHWGVTSLPAEVADAGRLLELRRGHWRSEIVQSQMTKPNMLARGGGRDHVADLDLLLGDYDAINQQLY